MFAEIDMYNSRTILVGAAALLLCSCSRYLFHRWTVLKAPIRFEEGFSTTQSFTVDRKIKYVLAVGFEKQTQIDLHHPVADDFSAEFSVSSDGMTITQGTNDSDSSHPSADRKDYTTRFLGTFEAEPGKKYMLFLRINRALPSLAPTKPVVTISVYPFP